MTKQTINIDPSIAVDVNFDRIGMSERVAIRFTASDDWFGIFEVEIYNSTAKNTSVKPTNALTVEGRVMTWVIEPAIQGLTERSHFYEIVEKQSKRIIFRGVLKITK